MNRLARIVTSAPVRRLAASALQMVGEYLALIADEVWSDDGAIVEIEDDDEGEDEDEEPEPEPDGGLTITAAAIPTVWTSILCA